MKDDLWWQKAILGAMIIWMGICCVVATATVTAEVFGFVKWACQ